MAINKETQISASVVLDKKVYKVILDLAQANKRSASSQMAFMLEEYLKNKETEI